MEMDPTLPLLRKTAPASTPAPPLNSLQRSAITLFSAVRIARGLIFMAWPALGLSSFDIPQGGATFLLGSLLGSRELLLGALLWTADLRCPRETRRALLANLVSDAADTLILIFSAVLSWHWRNPFIEIAMSALLASLEHLTLWSMSPDGDAEGDATAAYRAGLQAADDKNRRLDTWLSELRMAEAQTVRAASTLPPESTA
ncbi:hypothetical protein ACRE_089950 [Hapsidospora chrysogenum ATCC 11550]|uniref:Uncharacterized protein n=1 Tax=Hapsidospora chrysogenum (strain ATCC 11550 / CBS 779.69 / DSM 880 / IAM 14645 / JCM 23072 / IMI 49137) TaxID=857340 RepID=A0A086STB5_HAPC1|nr:hypothetical protein ACRE_089950 [Hapsidospora chrysogenum ATCC 11550]